MDTNRRLQEESVAGDGTVTEVVRIDGLAIGYRRKVVAETLSGGICRGQLTCLIGRNGLGKSTLLRTLAAETGKAILLSTHDLQLALQLFGRLLTIDHGLREMSKAELAQYLSDMA